VTILDIVLYPDKALRTICSPVEAFDSELSRQVSDMVETMYYHKGTVGLAAPQVNILKCIVVIDITAKTTQDKLLVLINPEILSTSKNKYVREGCLSVPEYLADIKRAKKTTIKAQNINGEWFEYTTSELEAVAIQHEVDHLEGIVFLDRIDSVKTGLFRRGSSVHTAGAE
jgi:peptide deformylase